MSPFSPAWNKDASGIPVSGAMVSVRAHTQHECRVPLRTFHSAATDKADNYRVGGLFPNRYFVLVKPRLIKIAIGGNIKICRLPPGRYRLDAEGIIESKPPMGSVKFRISDKSISLLKVEMQPAQELSGTIVVFGDQPQPDSSRLRVRLEPTSRMMTTGEVLTAVADKTNCVTIPSVFP